MGKRWLFIIAAFALLAVASCGKKAPPQPLEGRAPFSSHARG